MIDGGKYTNEWLKGFNWKWCCVRVAHVERGKDLVWFGRELSPRRGAGGCLGIAEGERRFRILKIKIRERLGFIEVTLNSKLTIFFM